MICLPCYAKASGKKEEKEAEKAMETKQPMNLLLFLAIFIAPKHKHGGKDEKAVLVLFSTVARIAPCAEQQYQQQ